MAALTASSTKAVFISGGSRRRLVTHNSGRVEEVSVLTLPASAPLRCLRHSLGLPNVMNGRYRGKRGVVWEEEELDESHDLVAEIYELMEMSANPMLFPSKEYLIAAGREDLVRAIAKKRGWLAYGWDSEDDNEVTIDRLWYGVGKMQYVGNSGIFQHKMASVIGEADASLEAESNNILASWENSMVSSSWRPMDTYVSDDAEIEGISSRLEKQRILAFSFVQRKKKSKCMKRNVGTSNLHLKGSWNIEGHRMSDQSSLRESSRYHFSSPNSHNWTLVDINNKSELGTWRTWSIQRSGDPLTNFEAAEIVLDEEQKNSELKFVSHLLIGKDKENASVVQLVTEASSKHNCPYDNHGSLKNEISIHLRHLESQLTSALQLFKFSNTDAYSCKDEDQESLLKVLHKLSDALEFQQNELKKASDLLRSTRANLAVIEGKIALEVIESQKSIEERQKRLHAVEKVLSMLRSVWIVWPNSASEVLLAGSFDGWTSQWRMEKKTRRAGGFSLCLKLYPGRYEIKFIVDGVWTVDQLRPVVNSNGFQNNLLIVT